MSNQLAFSYDRLWVILTKNEITRGLPGKYVDTYEFTDGQLEVRWKGVSLPYSTFDKDQRDTHAAVTENKHLSAVLEHVRAERRRACPRRVGWGSYGPATRRPDAATTAGTVSPPARPRRTAQPAKASMSEVSALSGCAPAAPR